MRYILGLFCLVILQSCFPVAIAPDLSDGSIKRAKKFNKKLPNRYSYIFTDPKDADEFYTYINTKYDLQHNYVEDNVPIVLDGDNYYISFYEVSKNTKTVNLLRPLANKMLEENGIGAVFDDDPVRIYGDTWYIALLITDEDFNDGLNPSYKNYARVEEFASSLHKEYYSMRNYRQAILTVKNENN